MVFRFVRLRRPDVAAGIIHRLPVFEHGRNVLSFAIQNPGWVRGRIMPSVSHAANGRTESRRGPKGHDLLNDATSCSPNRHESVHVELVSHSEWLIQGRHQTITGPM